MKKQSGQRWMIAGLLAFLTLVLGLTPTLAHHSFAMYDQNKVLALTGVAYQFVAQANHAEIHFYLVGPDGKLVKDKDGKNADWGVEMAGAAAMAQNATVIPSRSSIKLLLYAGLPSRPDTVLTGQDHATSVVVKVGTVWNRPETGSRSERKQAQEGSRS